jgi:hypothetical protein
MSIEKIEKMLYINSKVGQAVFESILTGALFFIIIFGVANLFKFKPTSTNITMALVCALFGAIIGLLGRLNRQ